METTSNFRLFFKRLLFIIAAAVIVILVLYGCSTSRAVSQYKTYLIANDIGTKYQSRDAVYVLEIVSENEAYFYVNDSVEAYQTEVKDNLLLLTSNFLLIDDDVDFLGKKKYFVELDLFG